MTKKYKAMIFDMDDVIIDSMKLHVKLEKAVAKKYGIKAPVSVWHKFPGWKIGEIFKYLIDNYGGNMSDLKYMIKDKYAMLIESVGEEIEEIPGAMEFVKQAHNLADKTALVTSSEKVFCDAVLKKFNIKDDFDLVITAKDIIKGKPDPEPYEKVVRQLRIKPSQAIVIEDAVNGIVSAKGAGCLAIGITTTFSSRKLIEVGADYVVKNYSELRSLLNNIL